MEGFTPRILYSVENKKENDLFQTELEKEFQKGKRQEHVLF